MNRYDGNTGRFTHIPDPIIIESQRSSPIHEDMDSVEMPNFIGNNRSRQSGLFGGLDGILSKLGKLGKGDKSEKIKFETEDLILYAILYLMYRESGDIEFLLIAGAMFFM